MKKMTDGERLVWAATFADQLGEAYRDGRLSGTASEKSTVINAVEIAESAVECLRLYLKDIKNYYGEDSTTCRRLLEMLK